MWGRIRKRDTGCGRGISTNDNKEKQQQTGDGMDDDYGDAGDDTHDDHDDPSA